MIIVTSNIVIERYVSDSETRHHDLQYGVNRKLIGLWRHVI